MLFCDIPKTAADSLIPQPLQNEAETRFAVLQNLHFFNNDFPHESQNVASTIFTALQDGQEI
jgi:hypothetical protein